jgi:hypothetical protein
MGGKKKRRLIIGLIILISLFLLVIGFFTYRNYQIKKQATPVESLSVNDKFFPAIKAELQKIKEKYNSKVSETDKLRIWWISPDGFNIINDDSSGIELNIFDCEADFEGIAKLISPQIDKIMKQNGFKANQKNSSLSIEDDQFYDYIQAYENGAVKCVFVANPDCVTSDEELEMHYSFSLGCTETFDKNYQQQAPLLKDLGINDTIVRVEKRTGDFVNLSVNDRRTGYYIIAKLINGKWNEIFSGQDVPNCVIVEKYKIPKEIISDCNPNNP